MLAYSFIIIIIIIIDLDSDLALATCMQKEPYDSGNYRVRNKEAPMLLYTTACTDYKLSNSETSTIILLNTYIVHQWFPIYCYPYTEV